jgi:hypothetical protein
MVALIKSGSGRLEELDPLKVWHSRALLSGSALYVVAAVWDPPRREKSFGYIRSWQR